MKIQEFIDILKTKKSVLSLDDLEACGVYAKSVWYKIFQQKNDWPILKFGNIWVINRDDLVAHLQPLADQFPRMDVKDTINASSKRNCKSCSQPLSGVANRKQFCSLPCLLEARKTEVNGCWVPLNKGSITWAKQNMSLKQAAWMIQNKTDKIPDMSLISTCATDHCILPDHQSPISKRQAAINRAASARAIYISSKKEINPQSLERMTKFLQEAPALIREDLYQSAFRVLTQKCSEALLSNDEETAKLITNWLEKNYEVATAPSLEPKDSTFFPWQK